MLSLRSKQFTRLVSGLRDLGKKCTVIESCCGGLISSSIMAEPGSSAVYYGGSIAYNTRNAKKLLLNDSDLHGKLIQPTIPIDGESEGDAYVRSKLKWTAESAVAFCKQMHVDYAIAEGGAAGPTFRPEGLNTGFAAIAIAGRDQKGEVQLLKQKVFHSAHSNREQNMRFFADSAAKLACETIGIQNTQNKSTFAVTNDHELWLDRATVLRSDPVAIRDLEDRLDSQHVVLYPSTHQCLFASPTELALATSEHIPDGVPKTFLGFNNNKTPIFTIDVDSSFIPPEHCYFLPTRTSAPLLNKFHNELALYATAMSTWKLTHKFCSNCGSTQTPIDGGTCLQCNNPDCKTKSWPRQDPSIIVLVTNRDQSKALLARSPRHPPKLHTALAGFVEAGETYEKAVLREAYEETGIKVDLESITYLASQPWPFPRSTMIAFRATADESQTLNLDLNELVSASWFEKDHVAKAAMLQGAMMEAGVAKDALDNDPTLQVLIPPTGVVARALIDNWLQES